jgi:hypothetical protein
MAHFLDRDAQDHTLPLANEGLLMPAQTLCQALFQRQGREQVLDHEAVLDLGRLR